jgi:uncharacterized protein (TIGR03435 family)
MPDVTDMELLRNYVRRGSEDAFAELVRRHINLVYSAAFRQVGIAAHAEEITQAVFVILSRKAASLRPDTILDAWLYETTRLTALSFLRGERRRQFREQEALMQSALHESADASVWNEVAPLLDEAMARLGKRDREAVVLRFFKGKNLSEVAAAMQTTEAAAQSRVHRAVGKLQKFFFKRGVNSSTDAIAENISMHSVRAAPAVLAKTVTAVALAKGATASGSTLTLIKGALKIMAWTKAKTAMVAGVVVLLAAGTTTVTVKEVQKHKLSDAWRVRFVNFTLLEQAPPQVRILPSKFPPGGVGSVYGAWMGIGQPVATIVEDAYLPGAYRTKFLTELPAGNYDFIAKLPKGSKAQDVSIALQNEIRKKFGLAGHREMQNTDVLLLAVKNPNANGLRIHDSQTPGSQFNAGEFGKFSIVNRPLDELTDYLVNDFQIPVINGTGINSNVDVTLNWNRKDWEHPNLDGLKQALADQLGLELVPTNMPIEMLLVERLKN